MKQSTNTLLRGITVLDLTRLLPGPYCTQQLAQLGATVIKIEEPNGGDYARSLSPELFALVNRGKQSITLDLRQTEDQARFKELAKTADVVVESFRPGVMKKLGCDYEALKALNPKLVYAAITGYGQDGPYAERAGHDMNYLATAGVLDQIGSVGAAPSLSNVQIADLAGGAMNGAIGILAAVIGAQASGQGELVDISMTDGALAMNTVALAAINQTGKTPKRGDDMLSGALPNYRVYKCRDGRYLAIGALEPQFFIRVLNGVWDSVPSPIRGTIDKLLKATQAQSKKPKGQKSQTQKSSSSKNNNAKLQQISVMLNDPVKGKLLLMPIHWALSAAFKTKTRDQWDQWFADKDACVSAILSPGEAIQHPLFAARDMVGEEQGQHYFKNPIKFQQTAEPLAASPELGANNPT
jgi:crotonobetainyl-CoA:carnitine CoA-transferase CaiB-like acyl-CoA transferase